ncbi:hypothetical protein GCM10008983_22010 [Lentibacillus halophilus]|uniref:Heptaprenyl diphosphate synthase n=1 Tax=Lentibacillus halophilus TaxID=295065 RepID=A0ABN0ZE04_9BACI
MVMLDRSSMNMSDLKELIRDKIHNPLIAKYVQVPYLNDDKLYILTTILNNTLLSDETKKNYILATMLVQTALDIHDTVPETNERPHTECEEKSKQLSVLAGDYYSSLYYLLLSETEDIGLISVLAAAINEINETKMQLYYERNHESFNLVLQRIKKLDSLLITRVADFAGEKTIRSVAPEWLAVKKLATARTSIKNADVASFDIWNEYIAAENDQTIVSFLNRELEAMDTCLRQFPADFACLSAELRNTSNESLSESGSIAEEG